MLFSCEQLNKAQLDRKIHLCNTMHLLLNNYIQATICGCRLFVPRHRAVLVQEGARKQSRLCTWGKVTAWTVGFTEGFQLRGVFHKSKRCTTNLWSKSVTLSWSNLTHHVEYPSHISSKWHHRNVEFSHGLTCNTLSSSLKSSMLPSGKKQ